MKPFKKMIVFGLAGWILFILFTALNGISDSILFHPGYKYYGDKGLWHTLKYLWIVSIFLSGYCSKGFVDNVMKVISTKLRLWFVSAYFITLIAMRFIIFESILKATS